MTEVSHQPSPMTAADWDARLRAPDCSEVERAAFKAWCQADPDNQATFDELQQLLGGLRATRDVPEIRSMREAALAAGNPPVAKRRYWAWAAVAAVAVLAIGLVTQTGEQASLNAPSAEPTFATSIGERSTSTLEDGSVAILNTNTRLQLAFTDQERRVTLLRGQALFDVESDPDRPFVVIAGEQRITAVGTVFDVRFEGDDVEVTLVEGIVEVEAEAPLGTHLVAPIETPAPIRMTAGQILKIKALATPDEPLLAAVDAEQATLWRQGRVFFDDAPLSEAVSEMNRYSQQQIVVADRTLDQYRVNGMFRTGRQEAFIDAVESYFPVTVEHDAQDRIVLKPKREP